MVLINFLKYRTTFSDTRKTISEPGIYYNFPTDLEKITGEESGIPVSFSQVKDLNLEVNKVFYSNPYKIFNDEAITTAGFTTSNGNAINWNFRKIQDETDVAGYDEKIAVPHSGSQGSSFIYNFVKYNFSEPAFSHNHKFTYGSVEYREIKNFNLDQNFDQGTSVVILDPFNDELNNIPQHFTDVNIRSTSGTSHSVVYYKDLLKNHNKAEIVLNSPDFSRGLTKEDYHFQSGDPVDLIYNIRNSPNCFCKMGVSGNFNSYFDIYLIPVDEHAIFPGGYLIKNQHFFPACNPDKTVYLGSNAFFEPHSKSGTLSLEFYNQESRAPFVDESSFKSNPNYYTVDNCYTSSTGPSFNVLKLTNYKKIYNLLMFQETDQLPKIWSLTGVNNYPTIASEEYGDVTFFTWDSFESARNGFMYDYCQSSDFCGFCFGRSEKGETSCYADKLTRKNAVLSSTDNVLLPLASSERYNGSDSQGKQGSHSYAQEFNILLYTVIIVSVMFAAYINFNKQSQESKKTHGKIFGVFIIAFIISFAYLDSIIKSLEKCNSTYSPSCPTFSNPDPGPQGSSGGDGQHYTQYVLPGGKKMPLKPDPY